MMDINKNPEALPDSNSPLAQLLSSAQVEIGFEGGSDMFRYSTVIMQQMSGEASQPNQTYEYYRYNIQGSDENNLWGSIHAGALNDLQLIINQGSASPYYTGVAKILKAYLYSLVVDVWGKVPYTEAQQLTANTQPHYDDDATIYPKLVLLLTDGITDLGAGTSVLTPGTNSLIYTNNNFTTAKAQWIKFANTLKLRLALHYSRINPAKTVTDINAIITAGVPLMASNADNFSMPFFNVANQRNPISAFEVSRPNYLFVDAAMLNLMTPKNDPRRPFYFTDFPLGSGIYVGVSAAAPPPAPNNNYSRVHTFLRGSVTTPSSNGINSAVYSGDAPQRMLTYSEYCFIRAEAALMGASASPLANANAWFQAGITASMTEAGVLPANITTYIANNYPGPTPTLQQIIEEKYIASFGVAVEPWTDWRRTGFPVLSPVSNPTSGVGAIPRTLFYPQSEIDLNPNCPGQKSSSLQDKVFWDN
jgi:hypothetical protein